MSRFCVLILLFVFNVIVQAQDTWCIKGRVVDGERNEPVPSVHVTLLDLSKGTVTDAEGNFELCGLVDQDVTLQVRHTAFESMELKVEKAKNEMLLVRLAFKSYNTGEVTVEGSQSSIVKNYIPGKLTLKKEDVLAVPAFMGSPDVLKGLQLLPGMQSVSEGNSGIYVRGGSPGQNYILFDGIELMNPTHLMGIYSVFNPLLTEKVEFYKGNAPMHLSSRLASSIIVNTRNKKEDQSNWAGNVGNIASNLTYNGESANGKWYFSSGLRRSYLDVLAMMAKPFVSDENNYFENNNYVFFDYNGKLRYQSGRSNIQLSWYVGRDRFNMESLKNQLQTHSKWGNKGAALSWRYQLKDNLSMQHGLDWSDYFSDFGAEMQIDHLRFKADYSHLRYKQEYVFELPKHLLRWGGRLVQYQLTPNDIELSMYGQMGGSTDEFTSVGTRLYVSDHYKINKKWSVYGALGLNYYQLTDQETQSGQRESLDLEGQTECYGSGMVSLNYHPTEQSSVKASYAHSSQDMHLASLASIPLPTDIWMASTQRLHPEKGHQLTLGYFKEIKERNWQFGAEAYFKTMANQLLVKLSSDQEQEDNSLEDRFFKGDGKAYGAEFFFKKEVGDWRITTGYTIGWARQTFPEINAGKQFDAKYDRRHDLNALCTYQLNKRIDFSGVFVLASGNKATLPTGRYWLMGDIANDYSGVNNYRMPAYHRLDVSMNYKLCSNIFKESVLNFSIINLYSRSNPYYIYFVVEEGVKDYELNIKAKQVSLFPIMPSVSWRFKF